MEHQDERISDSMDSGRGAISLRATRAVRLRTSLERAFDCALSEWERGHAALGEPAPTPVRPGRMGNGFRIACRAEAVACDWIELEVRDFVEPQGWQAVSTGHPKVEWTWAFAAAGRDRVTITQVLEVTPAPSNGFLPGALWKRRAGRLLRQSLRSLEASIRRREALDRLRRRGWEPGGARPPPRAAEKQIRT